MVVRRIGQGGQNLGDLPGLGDVGEPDDETGTPAIASQAAPKGGRIRLRGNFRLELFGKFA